MAPPKDETTSQNVLSINLPHFCKETAGAKNRYEIEESGIRFRPTTKSPEGYLPQAEFDRVYWYNSLFQEVFIPFSEISSVNSYYGTIKLRDGRKYKFHTRQFKTRFGRPLKQLISK